MSEYHSLLTYYLQNLSDPPKKLYQTSLLLLFSLNIMKLYKFKRLYYTRNDSVRNLSTCLVVYIKLSPCQQSPVTFIH